MNKPPQPITGPTSVPNPSPSPGLTQVSVADLVGFKFSVVLRFGDMSFIPHCLLLKAAYGPGQPPSLVFATPPPPQMNSAPQPRQVKVTPCVVPPHPSPLWYIFCLYR